VELAGFVRLFEQHPALERVMLNPAVPVPRKRAAMVELLANAKPLSVLGKLLVMLAERDRLVLLPDLLEAYRERLLDFQNVVRAEVTTATALPAERAKAIEAGLTRATKRTIRLSTRVDPSILGGAVTRIGGTVYDGSVTGQLKKMQDTLSKNV
jgi:F-type H+-transporting ATPase subunit delta